MMIVIMLREGVSGVKVLVAEGAEMFQVKVQFNVPPHLCLVLHLLGTSETLILDWTATITSAKEGVQHGVQI